MKKTTTIGMVFIVVVLVAVRVVLWKHDRQLQRLTPQEKEAMEFLPGYSFLFEGERIEIKEKWTHKGFLEQHRMVPFLEDIVPLLQTCHWQKDRPPLKSRKRKTPSLLLSLPGLRHRHRKNELLGLERSARVRPSSSEDTYDNLSDSAMKGERGDCLREEIDALDEADSAFGCLDLEDAINALKTAIGEEIAAAPTTGHISFAAEPLDPMRQRAWNLLEPGLKSLPKELRIKMVQLIHEPRTPENDATVAQFLETLEKAANG